MKLGPLVFAPVDLANDHQSCVKFRADSFVCSFGDDSRFFEEDGKGAERYLEWLRARISEDPWSAVHVWLDKELVGQLELGRFKSDPSKGYVNLYYLVPAKRGLGLSGFLDEFACHYLKNRGFGEALLSVSPTNLRAIAFYEKMGWEDLGPRPGHPRVNLMKKVLSPAP